MSDLGLPVDVVRRLPELGRLRTVEGEVGDGILAGGHYHYALWVFHAEAGESAAFALRSTDFDAYLYLFDGETGELLASDDDGLGGTDSLIRITLPHSRPYILAASSYGENEHGRYTLEHRRDD